MLEMGSQFDEASEASHSDYLKRLDAPDALDTSEERWKRQLGHG